MPKWKVYISSTFKDLKEFRSDIIYLFHRQLNNNFELCEVMEKMYDKGSYATFVQDCIAAVKQCDIYIIILGNKTGSFPPGEKTRTYTEIELLTAIEEGKNIFCLRPDVFDEAEMDNKAKHAEILSRFAGRPVHTFNTLETLENGLLKCLLPFAASSPVNKRNPYKGLAAFDVEDEDYFFGRNEEIEALIKKILLAEGNIFISVLGNSGIGKTSFVQAGILSRLKHQPQYGFADYTQVIITPGSEPFSNFRYQLQLQQISTSSLLTTNTPSLKLLLFFNQFEEIIAQCHTEKSLQERDQLLNFLDQLALKDQTSLKLVIITTFRSDFLSHLVNFDFIRNHQFFFPLSSLDYKVSVANWQKSMTEIIYQPALKHGVTIEDELVIQLLHEIKDIDGALPILQFTLEKIWSEESVSDKKITSTEYNNLSEGKGIAGIIQLHATDVVNTITENGTNKQKVAILKSIFVNLVEVGENLSDVRKTIKKDALFKKLELYPAAVVTDVFEKLVSKDSRLLVISEATDKSMNVDIIHEVLIRKWEQLKTWVNEKRTALIYKKDLLRDISEWQYSKQSSALLYPDKKLKKLENWLQQNPDLNEQQITRFAAAGKAKRRNKRLAVAALLLVCIIAGVKGIDYYNKVQLCNNDLVNGYKVRNFDPDEVRYMILYDTFNLEQLECFNSLDSLNVYAGVNLDKIPSPEDIMFLSADVDTLNNLSGFDRLTGLKSLKLYYVKDISGIEKLNYINTLDIATSNDSISTKTIENLTQLTSLQLRGFETRNLSFLGRLSGLSSFSMENAHRSLDFSGIEHLKNLTTLTLNNCDSLQNIARIRNLHKLTILNLESIKNFYHVSDIVDLKAPLTSLHLCFFDSLDIAGIEGLQQLSTLRLEGVKGVKNISAIAKLSKLVSLSLQGLDSIDLKDLEKMKTLTTLSLEEIGNIHSLEEMHLPPQLVSLTISLVYPDTLDLTGIEKLTALKQIVIQSAGVKHLENIQSLTGLTSISIPPGVFPELQRLSLPQLTYLNLGYKNPEDAFEDAENPEDLLGISKFNSLVYLAFNSDGVVKNVSEIKRLSRLKQLDFFGTNYSLKEVLDVAKVLPDCKVHFTRRIMSDNDD